MKISIKPFFVGFGAASLLFAVAVAVFVYCFAWLNRSGPPTFREQRLPSGNAVKVTMCNLLWGVEHDERRSGDDTFGIEYVSTTPHADLPGLDQETLEVFELIRSISEQWGLPMATVSAFPTAQRKGRYYLYSFTRAPGGKWSFERKEMKVFIND